MDAGNVFNNTHIIRRVIKACDKFFEQRLNCYPCRETYPDEKAYAPKKNNDSMKRCFPIFVLMIHFYILPFL